MVIGGYNAEGIMSDVWEFDLETREWARINIVAGPAPPERAYFRGDRCKQVFCAVHRASCADSPHESVGSRFVEGIVQLVYDPWMQLQH